MSIKWNSIIYEECLRPKLQSIPGYRPYLSILLSHLPFRTTIVYNINNIPFPKPQSLTIILILSSMTSLNPGNKSQTLSHRSHSDSICASRRLYKLIMLLLSRNKKHSYPESLWYFLSVPLSGKYRCHLLERE